MNTKLIERIVCIGLLAFSFVSCKNSLFQDTQIDKTGSLTVEVGEYRTGANVAGTGARTILPPALSPTALVYDLTLTRAGATTITAVDLPSNALTLGGISIGTWTLTITGKLSGLPVFAKTGAVNIVSGANNLGTWTLEPIMSAGGMGTLLAVWSLRRQLSHPPTPHLPRHP
jgi:hypothetical protein